MSMHVDDDYNHLIYAGIVRGREDREQRHRHSGSEREEKGEREVKKKGLDIASHCFFSPLI
jgi:hypothetical protein